MRSSKKHLAAMAGFTALALMSLAFNPAALAADSPRIKALDTAAPSRVLFVGNSYLYYGDSLHNHVSRLVAADDGELGQSLQYKSATIGGASLDHHPLASLLQPGRLGIDERFQLVILQGGSAEPLSARRREEFLATAAEMDAKIAATDAETALYMTHAYAPPHRRFDPDMIDAIAALYLEAGDSLGALVIPVGLAFEEAYRRKPGIALHKSFDGSHPDILGTYLAACVVFASIYERPCRGNSYDYFDAISKDDAYFLQTVADDTVQAFFGR